MTFLRNLSGRRGLGAGEILLRINKREGSLTRIDDDLRAEIREYYVETNRRLEPRLTKLPASSC